MHTRRFCALTKRNARQNARERLRHERQNCVFPKKVNGKVYKGILAENPAKQDALFRQSSTTQKEYMTTRAPEGRERENFGK